MLYQLFEAVRGGKVEKVCKLLDSGLDVNAIVKGRSKFSLLQSASFYGHAEVVKLLLNKGAEVNKQDIDRMTPLHYASCRGHMEIVNLLLNNGANVNAKDYDGRTPLHYASSGSHAEIVKLLLERGADINAQDDWGDTSLHCASRLRKIEVAALLLAKGADVDMKNDCGGKMALDVAKENGRKSIVKLIISFKQSRDASNQPSQEVAVQNNTQQPAPGGNSHIGENNTQQPEPNADANQEAAGENTNQNNSHVEVGKWLSKFLPEADAARYLECLIEDGFDRMDILKECLEEGDLHFMKKGHKRITLKRLAEAERIVIV